MGIHDDTSIYSREWGWTIYDEGRAWWDEAYLWENKTIRVEVNGYHVGTIQTKVPKRRNRTWD